MVLTPPPGLSLAGVPPTVVGGQPTAAVLAPFPPESWLKGWGRGWANMEGRGYSCCQQKRGHHGARPKPVCSAMATTGLDSGKADGRVNNALCVCKGQRPLRVQRMPMAGGQCGHSSRGRQER